MPRSPSPDRSRDRDRSRSPRRDRDRSRSPQSKPWSQRRAKELSFYKKGSASYVPPPRTGGLMAGEIGEEESAKERAQRRERGEVPKRFGGTREQGVRNTMGNLSSAPAAVGSLKRSADPLDRMGARGERREKEREPRRERDRDRDYGRELDRARGVRHERRGDRDRDDRHRERRDDHRRDRDGDRERRRDDRDRDGERGSGAGNVHPDRAAAAAGSSDAKPGGPVAISSSKVRPGRMIDVIANDRMGRKVRIKCMPTDTVGDLKRLIAAQTGTSHEKIILKKWYTAFKDHVTLQDYEINDGMSLEMY